MRRSSNFETVRVIALVALAGLTAIVPASAQVTLVNMVPAARSGETNQDSEPSITINPSNPNQIAATAFTWDNLTGGPMVGANAPIYVSEDGGQTWTLAFNVPSAVGSAFPTGDIMSRFSNTTIGTTNLLYTGILHAPEFSMRVFRAADFRLSVPMTLLDTRTNNVDQPHVRAATVLGGPGTEQDRLYVGFNNGFGGVAPQTASVDYALNAAIAAPTFNVRLLETRSTGSAGQDGFANVPAIHPDGTVYVVFYGWRASSASGVTTDVVVVRDDNWATGTAPFTALTDPGDGLAGLRVVTDRTIGFGNMGQQRLGASNLAIAVDPRDSRRVYIAWGERPAGATVPTQRLHVRRSTDRGVTWSGDLLTVTDAVNPGLAINSRGRVAFLYQRHVGSAPNSRWETHLTRTTDADATLFDNPGLLLANTPSSTPALMFHPYIGDYAGLIAYGKDFYGIFSANNTPDEANFPSGRPIYQRNHNFSTKKLLALDNTTEVPASIDPFFFRVEEKEPAPRYAYVGCSGHHHLAGDTGTGLYFWHYHRWLVNLEYDGADENHWYYHEKEYPEYNWAFARKPNPYGQFALWFFPDKESAGKWVFYEDAHRIRPVNAKAHAARSLREE